MHNLIIIGAGGHAKVIADIALKNDYTILGFLDDNPAVTDFLGLKKLGSIDDCPAFANNAEFIIAIGNNSVRKRIAEKYALNFATLVHPSAIIGSGAEIGKGTVIMPLAVINAAAKIGEHCIINSGSVIEHDNLIGNYTHISPNATLCGTVKIGETCHVGAGATVINNISVCDNCTIGAGAVVVKDLERAATYAGVPAKVIK